MENSKICKEKNAKEKSKQVRILRPEKTKRLIFGLNKIKNGYQEILLTIKTRFLCRRRITFNSRL